MIMYYQELTNECIDLTEWKEKHKKMLSTLEIMKEKLKKWKGGNKMNGKHTEEALEIKRLEERLQLREKEIKDIKHSLADTLQLIRDLNESNIYEDSSQRKRKISEICTDTIYELHIDELNDFYKKEETEAKIIELPNNRQTIR